VHRGTPWPSPQAPRQGGVQGLGWASLSPQCRIDIPDEPYRWKRDTDVTDTRGIARLSANTDVGYWRCPKPLKVVVTRRSLQVEDGYHTQYPPREELMVVSLPAGYLVHSSGPNSCSLTYLAQVDPKGNSGSRVVNKASQYLARQGSGACVKYPAWKQQHDANMKPWLYPEQNKLPLLAQRAASLENVDESGLSEVKDERGDHSRSYSLTN
uniref:START domain-containing protein n=1 Tax=Aquila chrysaetos chrysaetos TaxID=223781 RepID=A0A663EYP4_AQUCH